MPVTSTPAAVRPSARAAYREGLERRASWPMTTRSGTHLGGVGEADAAGQIFIKSGWYFAAHVIGF